ncbi:MAG: HAD family hydrolase [Planctomycetota bacterium]
MTRHRDAIPHAPHAKAILLDRDDTLNENHTLPAEAYDGTIGDLYNPAFVRLLPGAREACAELKAAGYRIVIITNQGGCARGHCTLKQIEATNDRLRALMHTEASGTLIDAVYAAPHHPDAAVAHLRENHPWRKPGPGMIIAAARELYLDLARSWMIGDKQRDKDAGINAGIPSRQCIRIATGKPDPPAKGPPAHAPDFADLPAAARFILAGGTNEPQATPARFIETTTVRLRARGTTPLASHATRETVLATARGIAERTGIDLIDLACTSDTVTATLATNRLAALGFMAELRRVTNRWHASRQGREQLGELWAAGDFDTEHQDPTQ